MIEENKQSIKKLKTIKYIISILILIITMLSTFAFATSQGSTLTTNDIIPPRGKLVLIGGTSSDGVNYVDSNGIEVEIIAKDNKSDGIKYYVSSTEISNLNEIAESDWNMYQDGVTELITLEEGLESHAVYLALKDAAGNTSVIYTGSNVEYTINYNENAADATMFDTIVNTKSYYGMPFMLTSQKPIRDNYSFAGWSTNPNANIPSFRGGDIIPANVFIGGSKTITLYAVWGGVTVNVDGLGEIEVNNPNIDFTYNPDTGELGGVVPPPANEPEIPEEIPEENLPEIIEFGYGNFEAKTNYTPGTYETVEYETTYTRLKSPVSYWNRVLSEWRITKDAQGNIISTEPGDMQLADIDEQYSTYIVYDFETEKSLESNGVKGDSVELWTIYDTADDTLENAVYIAAYLNKLDGKTTRHIAKWNGTQYVAHDADAQINAVDTFVETYTVTNSKQVQITAPSSSTEYVYIPAGNLKAEKGMTWAEWLVSEYNTTGETEVTIKTSDYVDVSNDAKIVAGEDYGFAVSASYYTDTDSNKKVYILSDSEITNSNHKTSDNIEEILQAEGETTQVPVPTGFTYYLGTGDTGLVVKDGSGNEFVWIPVNLTAEEETAHPDRTLISDMYGTGTYTLAGSTGVKTSKYGKHNLIGGNSSYEMKTPGTTSGYREPDLVKNYDTDTTYLGLAGFSTATELANDLVTEFNNMITSVEKYGGFFVGRYELGYDSGVVCKPGVTALTASTSSGTNYYGSEATSRWYGLYKASKTFTQGGVTSSMIWGTQWDAMVNFIGDHKATNPGSRFLTGASEYNDKYKNVYDTSTGTVCEWTATAYHTYNRANRGGLYSGYANASSNRGIVDANSTSTGYGTRTQLYIKN